MFNHYIKASGVFSECTREEIENLIEPYSKMHHIPANGHLFRAGEQAKSVWIIVSGKANLYRLTCWGKTLVSEVAVPTASIGWEDVLARQTYTHSAITLEDCVALEVASEDVYFLTEHNRHFARALTEHISRRLVQTLQQQMSLLYLPVRQRIAHSLLLLHKVYNNRKNTLLPTKRSELASMAAVTRETATRIVKEFEREHLLVVSGAGIMLCDPERIEHLSKGHS